MSKSVSRRCGHSMLMAILQYSMISTCCLWIGLIVGVGCGFEGYIFTIGECAIPDRCGRPGRFLVSQFFYVTEISEEFGEITYIPDLGGAVGGMAFERTNQGLELYVATPLGIYVQQGDAPNPRAGLQQYHIPVPHCTLADIVLVGPQSVVAACSKEKTLVRVNLATQDVETLYPPDIATSGASSFQPFVTAFDGDCTVLTGLKQIDAFDLKTGELKGAVVAHGFQGATEFRDFVYGPDGKIYVSANPNIGILVLHPADYSLERILARGGVEGMPTLGPITFSEDGRLFLLSGEDTRDGYVLVEIDRSDGTVASTILGPQVGCCNGGAMPRFMIQRPDSE